MPNKHSAKEWLIVAEHDFSSAKVLYKDGHYTDTIGMLLQQSLEKMLKSVLAYNNKPIKKSHDLLEIYSLINLSLLEENELDILELATGFFQENRYPNAFCSLPAKSEIKKVLSLAETLLNKIAQNLIIDMKSSSNR